MRNTSGNRHDRISPSNLKSASATIRGTDSDADLAVVEVNTKDMKASTLKKIAVITLGDSSKLKTGERAIAIGNALGYGQSVTGGFH